MHLPGINCLLVCVCKKRVAQILCNNVKSIALTFQIYVSNHARSWMFRMGLDYCYSSS